MTPTVIRCRSRCGFRETSAIKGETKVDSHRNLFAYGTGANKMARAITERVQQGTDQPLIADYGEINGDYSLTTNQFGVKVPKDSYSVCRHLVGGPEPDFHWTDQGGDDNWPPKLKPGDRVLVLWIGNDPCVVDVVWSAERL